jgi:hypothetical protein
MLIKFHVYCKFDVPGHVVPIRMNDDLRNLHNKRLHQDHQYTACVALNGKHGPILGEPQQGPVPKDENAETIAAEPPDRWS